MSIEQQFENFKNNFIINSFADNIYFNQHWKIISTPEPHAPKLDIWTAQPKEAIKSQNHL